jgi:phage shock protein E
MPACHSWSEKCSTGCVAADVPRCNPAIRTVSAVSHRMNFTNIFRALLLALLVWQLVRMFFGKVAPDKAKALVASGALLVDVRSPAEHRAQHIAGSVNIPVGEVGERLAEFGDKTKPVVVYCASGMRSASAAKVLKKSGFTEVYDLGSVTRW